MKAELVVVAPIGMYKEPFAKLRRKREFLWREVREASQSRDKSTLCCIMKVSDPHDERRSNLPLSSVHLRNDPSKSACFLGRQPVQTTPNPLLADRTYLVDSDFRYLSRTFNL